MQIYTNFESNSQHHPTESIRYCYCFRCKFTQILKAIHNIITWVKKSVSIVSDANLHKFWKQFTTKIWNFCLQTVLFPMQIYTNFESNSQPYQPAMSLQCIVSDANLHKFWKQFTTIIAIDTIIPELFPMQIYTNFESNSQPCRAAQMTSSIVSDANLHKFWKQFTTANNVFVILRDCFRCKFTQILKAIHNNSMFLKS